jgi:hypothetical protein
MYMYSTPIVPQYVSRSIERISRSGACDMPTSVPQLNTVSISASPSP